MWQKVAKFKGAEYFRKALYIGYITFTFKSFSRRSYPERLTNWCIHLMTSSGTATLQ